MVDAEYTAKFWIKSIGYIDVEIFITKNYLCFNGGDDLKIVVPFLLFKKLQKVANFLPFFFSFQIETIINK